MVLDLAFTAPPKVRLRSEQAPAGGKRWAERAADEKVVIHIPDGCLPRASVVKHVVRLPVRVKVGCGH